MKKIVYSTGMAGRVTDGLCMHDRDYARAAKELEQVQKGCRTATFTGIDSVLEAVLEELHSTGCPRGGIYSVTVPYTAEEYSRGCKWTKQCTVASATVKDRLVIGLSFTRGETGGSRVYTDDMQTAANIISLRVMGCKFAHIWIEGTRLAILGLAQALRGQVEMHRDGREVYHAANR